MSILVLEASNDTYVEAALPDTMIVKVGTATLREGGDYDNAADWDFPFSDEHLFPMNPEFCSPPKEIGEDDDRFWQFCLDGEGCVTAYPVDCSSLEAEKAPGRPADGQPHGRPDRVCGAQRRRRF